MLKKEDSIQKIRTFFFVRRIYIRKGSELAFLDELLEGRDSISTREVLEMRDRGRFNGHPLVDETPLSFYSMEDIESEYLKSLIEEKFRRNRQAFWNQEKIKNIFRFANSGEITLKQLSFLKKQKGDNFNYYYLCNDAVEQQKYCLRAYHSYISSWRKRQLERIVERANSGF